MDVATAHIEDAAGAAEYHFGVMEIDEETRAALQDALGFGADDEVRDAFTTPELAEMMADSEGKQPSETTIRRRIKEALKAGTMEQVTITRRDSAGRRRSYEAYRMKDDD